MDDRSKLLQDLDDDKYLIEHNGVKVEVRPPTVLQQKQLRLKAWDKRAKEVDGTDLTVHMIIACTFKPGSKDRMFEEADFEALASKSTSPRSLVGKISKALKESMQEDEETEKNSEADPADA